MRCPNCGTDSASSSPRCAQCDAPLVPPGADDATALDSAARAGDAGAHDQTSRDPFSPPPGGRTPDADDATVQDDPYGAPYSGSPMGSPPPGGNPSGTDDATIQDDPYRSLYSGGPMGGTPPGGNPPNADDATIQGAPYGGEPHGSAPYGSSPYGSAPYGGAPYGGGPPGESTPGGVPVPRDPVPPPWGDQNPVQWEPRPDHTLNMPPAEERTTHLSPEPWAAEPWSEPAIWQPPAPPKRSTMPYFLGAVGVVLLIGMALGIVFWPSGSDKSPPTASGPSTGQSQSVASASDSPASGGDLDAQAAAVNGLLEEMGGTRSDLGSVVTQGCPVSGVRRVLDARRGELEKARGLEVGALLDGEEMKAALVRALEASTESNQRYLEGAPGCPSESEVADVNQRASSAKSEFIGYWNVVAEKAGLPTRTESDI